MDTNKQTAVEWLQWALEHTILTHEQVMQTIGLFQQAKAIEKEQIISAYSHGWHDGQDVIIEKIKHIDLGGDAAGDVHYTQTYERNRNYKAL